MKLHNLLVVGFVIMCLVTFVLFWTHFAKGGDVIDGIQRQYRDSLKEYRRAPTPDNVKQLAEIEFYIKGVRLFDLMIQQLEKDQKDDKR
jgi:hypothetical protein